MVSQDGGGIKGTVHQSLPGGGDLDIGGAMLPESGVQLPRGAERVLLWREDSKAAWFQACGCPLEHLRHCLCRRRETTSDKGGVIVDKVGERVCTLQGIELGDEEEDLGKEVVEVSKGDDMRARSVITIHFYISSGGEE